MKVTLGKITLWMRKKWFGIGIMVQINEGKVGFLVAV